MNTEKQSSRDAARRGTDALTQHQIVNWRKLLVGMLGPAALTLPAEDIKIIRDDVNAAFGEHFAK